MKWIDLSTWDRSQHYQAFRNSVQPQYCVTFDLDITNFLPKIKAKATEATEESAEAAKGALAKANVLAEAEAKAEAAEAAQDMKLAQAIALIVSRAADLTTEQRAMLASVLATEAEATEAEA